MDDFKEIYFEEMGDNGMDYTVADREKHDMDRMILQKLNMPLLHHLHQRLDYEGIGKLVCGVMNQVMAKMHDD